MMKSVLISIQPQWAEKIANGEKTIEVRKTAPQEVPFKCYIYETQGRTETPWVDEDGHFIYKGRGQVIGEFVCDKIDDFYCASVPYQRENNLGYGQFIDNGVYKVNGWHEGIVFERNDRFIDSMLNNNDLKEMCLSAQELFDYIGIGKHLYGWHISDLKIYDKPKELGDFKKHCHYKDRNSYCLANECEYYSDWTGICCNWVERPPQSWCYVEDLGEEE